MTERGAEKAIITSALIVAGIYTYRVITEGTSSTPTSGGKISQLAGKGSPATLGVFITGWGATFLVISVIAAAAPGLGGAMALLVATGDAIGNLGQLAADINKKVAAPQTTVSQTGVINVPSTGPHHSTIVGATKVNTGGTG